MWGAGLFLGGGVEVVFVVREEDEAVNWLADLRARSSGAVVPLVKQDILGAYGSMASNSSSRPKISWTLTSLTPNSRSMTLKMDCSEALQGLVTLMPFLLALLQVKRS